MPMEREFNLWRSPEMKTTLEIGITSLGPVLEGEGKISSSLEKSEYGAFEEGLRQSVVEIEEPNCAACIDGRCTRCLRSGQKGKTRPRKAGGSISTLVMMGLGDRLFLDDLQDNDEGAGGLYATAGALQLFLDNRESGHEDCGAANGIVDHLRSVAGFDRNGPSVNLVKTIIRKEHRLKDMEVDELISPVINQAVPLANVFESRGWSGSDYADHISEDDPEAIEVLVTKDDEVHGHAEQAVVVIDGPVDENGRPLHTIDKNRLKELTGMEAFIVNLNELRRDANKLGSTPKQKAQLLTASLLHLGGTYKNLGDGSHPVFVLTISR